MSSASRTPHLSATRSTAGPTPLATGRIFAFLFFALAALTTFNSREVFFRTACYEEGDDAANGLQIARAKNFQELHGNYSRWGFHHPGPAFFYAYAAGEWLLHDVTHLAPAPRNAHVYTGTLLQLAFYAGALTLLARHSRQPRLAAALALAAGALHFAQIERDHLIYSVWPPDVLIMPFLCFLVAAAAVAQRDRIALPPLIVSASFLVHGHVAQPLFVVPITLLVLWLAWRPQLWTNVGAAARSRTGRVSLALLAVFVSPLAFDLLAGRESNFAHILRHLRFQTDAGQTFWQSVLCYASYFCPLLDQSIFNQLSPASYAPFGAHLAQLLTWSGLLALVAWRFARRLLPLPAVPDGLRFGRQLLLLWCITSALTLGWGMRQDGGFTSFNSDFNHALVHVVALLAVLALTELLPLASAGFSRIALASALTAFALALPYEGEIGTRGGEVEARFAGLLQADPHPSCPKLITWDIADEDWYESITVARAFQRRGIPFFVHDSWRFMFGDDHVFRNDDDPLGRGAVSLWHIVQRAHAPAGAHVLNRDYAVVFPRAAPPPLLPTSLKFGRDHYRQWQVFGITPAEPDWSWTEGRAAAILVHRPAVTTAQTLTLAASGNVTKSTSTGQTVILRVNGTIVGNHQFTTETPVQANFSVPLAVWNRQTPQTIVLELPDAVSPARLGHSGDRRQFGLRLYGLTVHDQGTRSP